MSRHTVPISLKKKNCGAIARTPPRRCADKQTSVVSPLSAGANVLAVRNSLSADGGGGDGLFTPWERMARPLEPTRPGKKAPTPTDDSCREIKRSEREDTRETGLRSRQIFGDSVSDFDSDLNISTPTPLPPRLRPNKKYPAPKDQ